MKDSFVNKFKIALKKAVDGEDYMKYEMELIKSGKRTKRRMEYATKFKWIAIAIAIFVFIAFCLMQKFWM